MSVVSPLSLALMTNGTGNNDLPLSDSFRDLPWFTDFLLQTWRYVKLPNIGKKMGGLISSRVMDFTLVRRDRERFPYPPSSAQF